MIKVDKHPEYGFESVSGYLIIRIEAGLPDEFKGRTELTDQEAMDLLLYKQDYVSSSNDGSDLLANAKIYLNKPEIPAQ